MSYVIEDGPDEGREVLTGRDAIEVRDGLTFAMLDRYGVERIYAVHRPDSFTFSLARTDVPNIPRGGYFTSDLKRLLASGDARPCSLVPA